VKIAAAWLALLAALTGMAGCVTMGPETAFYTLSEPNELDLAAPLASTPAVVVGPVQLPEMLDRPQIVTRQDSHRLKVHEFHRWGGSFGDEIARAVQADLVRLLGSDRVALQGTAEFPADYRVGLDIARFEGVLGGEVVLELRWSIFEGKSGKLAAAYRSRIVDTADGAGIEPVVAAQSRALGAVSRLIGEEIERQRNLK